MIEEIQRPSANTPTEPSPESLFCPPKEDPSKTVERFATLELNNDLTIFHVFTVLF